MRDKEKDDGKDGDGGTMNKDGNEKEFQFFNKNLF